jgi:hypothetical protein
VIAQVEQISGRRNGSVVSRRLAATTKQGKGIAAMNESLVTDRTREPAAHASLRHTEDRKFAEGSPRDAAHSRAGRVPAISFTRRSLPQLRWMTRAIVLLVILCFILAAWVWFQILRMSFS